MKAETSHTTLLEHLHELALDLHWTWNHATDKIWRLLDADLWELTHNPMIVLQTVSYDRIHEVLHDPLVSEIVEELVEHKRQRALTPAWFQNTFPASPLTHVAFFSMEFMLSEALPIYSGGLGNVSGDLLKTASDLGLPLTGVGLLYQQGYPRQVIYPDGSQQYVSPYNDPGQLPVMAMRKNNGEWLRIELQMPGYSIWLRTWTVQVGRVSLLLLDSNDPANLPVFRGLTAELYGGDAEMRLMQEIILGIGGWRLLQMAGRQPEVCHLNEGHSAFVILERARTYMNQYRLSFDEALSITRSGNIFTTHTAVGAGFDAFPKEMIKKYLGAYVQDELKISMDDFLSLGRENPGNDKEPFNTGFLALRGSNRVNAVSRLHEKISRRLFAPLFSRWPLAEVPVSHVTNGVHMASWDSPEADKLWTETCGKDRWLGSLDMLENNIRAVPLDRIWSFRNAEKQNFIDYLRRRYTRQQATAGADAETVKKAGEIFKPDVLTLGFARRFTGYKRPNLLLQHSDRLRRILSNSERPVQLVIAGKAHPGDVAGRELIRQWVRFIHSLNENGNIIFLSDYDMLLTEQLVVGVDVWLNTPKRPWEACGTSGMKILVNGGLNFSERDGWWDEAYAPELGWTFFQPFANGERPLPDVMEATRLYDILEYEIIPEYYQRNENGLPEKWASRIRESMAQLTPKYSSVRSLQQYVQQYYLPATDEFLNRSANENKTGRQLHAWIQKVKENWPTLTFENMQVNTTGNEHVFSVSISARNFQPDDISVEIFADALGDEQPFIQSMELITGASRNDTLHYRAAVQAQRPASDFTPRVRPNDKDLAIPLECACILWYR